MPMLLKGGELYQNLKRSIVDAINNSNVGVKHAGYEYIFVYGENIDLDTGSTEDVVSYGTKSYLPDDVGVITIYCDDARDTFNGTGAHEIYVIGLDADWKEITQQTNLAGLSTVTLPIQLKRVNDAYVGKCGTNEVNHDRIHIEHNGTPISDIQTAHGRAQNATYTVPFGKVGEIVEYNASINDTQSNQYADVHLQHRSNEDIKHGWHIHWDSIVMQGAPIQINLRGLYVKTGDDIVVRALGASSNDIHLFASFTLKLYDE